MVYHRHPIELERVVQVVDQMLQIYPVKQRLKDERLKKSVDDI